MFKYILSILILIILFGCLQLVGAGNSMHNHLINYYITAFASNDSKINEDKTSSNRQIIQCKRKGGWLLSWLTKDCTEEKAWEYYKKTFISDDGRVIDHQRNSVTTSEGQAYAMSRALMMRDKATFDKTYDWAKYNLQHKNDKLFAWLWGQKKPGPQMQIEWGILDPNGATDAGTEIAISLILASKLWEQQSYMDDALKIINDIWDKETIVIKGERIITAGMDQNIAENVEINPSYFMINAFRIFAKVDKKHNWKKLVNSSYRLTNWCIGHIESGLPPDVFYINKKTGKITFDKDKSDFCYDAVRVFYRFYVDYAINKDSRAEKLLSKSKLFINRWKQEKKFYTCYKQSGELKNYDEAIGSIAIILPSIRMHDKKVADEIYQDRIKAKYNAKGYWGDPIDYYAQNLVWFGNWLYQNEKNIKAFKY